VWFNFSNPPTPALVTRIVTIYIMWSLTRRPRRRPTSFSRPGALRTPSVHAQPRLSTALLHTSSTMRVGREHINLTPKDTFNWRKVRGEVMEPLRRPAPNLGSQNVTYIPGSLLLQYLHPLLNAVKNSSILLVLVHQIEISHFLSHYRDSSR